MPIRPIVPKSAASLQPTQPVNNFSDPLIQNVITDLIDTLNNQQAELDALYPGMGAGVGLSSNQIAYPEPDYPADFLPPNIYVVNIRPERAEREGCDAVPMMALINAHFVSDSLDQIEYEEGCLSITGFKGFGVKRYTKIYVTAFDENGKRFLFACSDFLARLHQHEIDHGLGGEFLNHMSITVDDLDAIDGWLAATAETGLDAADEWVIPERLQCVNKGTADLDALQAWLHHARDYVATTTAPAFS